MRSKLILLLMSPLAACGGGDLVSGVEVQLLSSWAGGRGGSCPNSAASFTLHATNTTKAAKVLIVEQIEVGGAHGTLVTVQGATVALDLDGVTFGGVIPSDSSLEIHGAAQFNTAFASYADIPGTWHSEVMVRIGQESTVLIGDDQTDTWAHTECYTAP